MLADELENDFRSFAGCIAGAEAFLNGVTAFQHAGTFRRGGVQQRDEFGKDVVGGAVFLQELRDNGGIANDVGQSDIFSVAQDDTADGGGDRRHLVDEHGGTFDDGGFERRRAGCDDGGIGLAERPAGLAVNDADGIRHGIVAEDDLLETLCRDGDDEGGVRVLLEQAVNAFNEDGHEAADFTFAATGQKSNAWGTLPRQFRFGLGEGIVNLADERIADVVGRQFGLSEERRLEGKNAEKSVEGFGNLGYTVLLPDPDFGADVLDGGDSVCVRPSAETEVEAGVVDSDKYIGAQAFNPFAGPLECFTEEEEFAKDLPETHGCHLVGVVENFNAFGMHRITADAVETELRFRCKFAQVTDKTRAVHIAGDFAGNDENGDDVGVAHFNWRGGLGLWAIRYRYRRA